MNDQRLIDDILSELYAVDPTLRQHEERLIKTVRSLLAAKPATKLDEGFVRRLREAVLAQFAAAPHEPHPQKKSLYDFLMKNDPFKYLIPSGIVAALVLAVAISTGPARRAAEPLASAPSATPEAATSAGVRISRASTNFGTLSAFASGDRDAARSLGLGGGGGNGALSAPAIPASEKMMVPYQPTYYRYVYKGDIALGDEQLDVYKRRKGGLGTSLPGSLLSTASLGLIDTGRLGSLGLQSLSLMQDKEFGYAVYVDMNEGMISLNQNYAKWPHPEQECRDEACYSRYRLGESDMLSDEQAFSISGDFLKELGVNSASYGAPSIQYDWRVQYATMKAEERASFYFPEIVSVTYPLVLNGQKVHEEGGAAAGVVVNVNVRHKRADGLWNLTTLDFDSASYAAVTDVEKLREIVSRGGVYEGIPTEDAKIEDVELGAPERALMRAWSGGQEVIVPALRFPVLRKPEGQPWFRDSVMIPLVKDLLEVPSAVPMPLMVK